MVLGNPKIKRQKASSGLYKDIEKNEYYFIGINGEKIIWCSVSGNSGQTLAFFEGQYNSTTKKYDGHLLDARHPSATEELSLIYNGFHRFRFDQGMRSTIMDKVSSIPNIPFKHSKLLPRRVQVGRDLSGIYGSGQGYMYEIRSMSSSDFIYLQYGTGRAVDGPLQAYIGYAQSRGGTRYEGYSVSVFSGAVSQNVQSSYSGNPGDESVLVGGNRITRKSIKRGISLNIREITQLSNDACNNRLEAYGYFQHKNKKIKLKFPELPGRNKAYNAGLRSDGSFSGLIGTAHFRDVEFVPGKFVHFVLYLKDEDDLACGGGDDPIDISPNNGQNGLSLYINYASEIFLATNLKGSGKRKIGNLDNIITTRGSNPDTEAAEIKIQLK